MKPKTYAGTLSVLYPGAHKTWRAMFSRCYQPSSGSYPRYGGAGITVCDRWRWFANFVDDMGERPAGMTIERENNDQPYEPNNCRWATKSEQQRNQRVNHLLTYNGRTQCLAAWCDETGLEHHTLQMRLKRGWDAARALETPARPFQSWRSVTNAT